MTPLLKRLVISAGIGSGGLTLFFLSPVVWAEEAERKTAGIEWSRKPRVLAFGSNRNGLIDGDLERVEITTAQPIEGIDGLALRDISLGRTHAAAVDNKGWVRQWGRGTSPRITLKGHDVQSLALS